MLALAHFFRAGKRPRGSILKLRSREIDPAAFVAASESMLTEKDMAEVELRNFSLYPPTEKYALIVANSLYVRHHRLPKIVENHSSQFCP
jgi:hypothetical protein